MWFIFLDTKYTIHVGTITGDNSGVIHLVNSTRLDAPVINSVASSSLYVYAGGLVNLPSSMTLPSSPLNYTIRGNYSGLTDLTLQNGAALILGGGPFYLNTLYGKSSSFNLVCYLVNAMAMINLLVGCGHTFECAANSLA